MDLEASPDMCENSFQSVHHHDLSFKLSHPNFITSCSLTTAVISLLSLRHRIPLYHLSLCCCSFSYQADFIYFCMDLLFPRFCIHTLAANILLNILLSCIVHRYKLLQGNISSHKSHVRLQISECSLKPCKGQ